MVRKAALVFAATIALTSCDNRPETLLVSEAHEAVLADLRDPESAKFNDQVTRAFVGRGLVCGGRVNSKNGFGGYTGEQPYYFKRGMGAVLGEQDDVSQMITECTEAYSELTATLEAQNRRNEAAKKAR